jgi:enoyl-CoA hydratase/carnithine racemase
MELVLSQITTSVEDETSGGIAIVRLNRPDSVNSEMMSRLSDALAAVED